MNKIYKPTFFRVLTNSTTNCILFVLAALFVFELFMPFAEQYLFIVAIMFLISILIAIALFTFIEHKYTYLELNKNGIRQVVVSSKKRTIFIPYDIINSVKIESYVVKVNYGDNKKIVLEYYKEIQEIKSIIEQNINKEK